MDTRFAGTAVGVGTGKILGRVHMTQMRLGNSFFPVSITILESNSMEFLLGLDTLKRHRCSIDLAKNILLLQDGSSGAEEIAFLSESEMPNSAKNSNNEEDERMDHDSSSSSSSSPPPPPMVVNETEVIQNLMALGFTEDRARQALLQANGDVSF